MFPEDITSKITIYPRFTDKVTNNQIAIRCVLEGCFWNDNSVSVFGRTGQQIPNSAEIFIPYDEKVTGRKYVTPDEWNNLPYDEAKKNYWTIDLTALQGQLPIIIKGDNPHEFEWTSSTAINRLTVQESDFMNSNRNARRIRDVNEQLFGTSDMQHILIRA